MKCKRTRIDNRMKSGKQHMNKMRSLVEKNRNHKKRNQTEILELKNTMKKWKKSIDLTTDFII